MQLSRVAQAPARDHDFVRISNKLTGLPSGNWVEFFVSYVFVTLLGAQVEEEGHSCHPYILYILYLHLVCPGLDSVLVACGYCETRKRDMAGVSLLATSETFFLKLK